MKSASNRVLGLSMSAGALIAAVGLSVQPGDFAASRPRGTGSARSLQSTPPPPPRSATSGDDTSAGL